MQNDECSPLLWLGDKELCTGNDPFGPGKYFLCSLEVSKVPTAAELITVVPDHVVLVWRFLNNLVKKKIPRCSWLDRKCQ